jgi:hypothetical protein
LKYGHKTSIELFSKQVANFILDLEEKKLIDLSNTIFLIGPYQKINTAASLLSKAVIDEINLKTYQISGLPSLESGKIHRQSTYFNDYALMDKSNRYNLIKSDKFYTDFVLIEKKNIILLDDIRITGVHENLMKRFFQENNFSGKLDFVFLAEIEENDFEASIEHELNSAFVKSIDSLIPFILNREIIYTTRFIKMLLNLDYSKFLTVIKLFEKEEIKKIITLSIGNNYHLEALFSINIKHMQKLIQI